MLRKAIIHIGPMKTGSTSIQHWLHQQAESLEQHGVHVVRAFGRNMSRLSAIVSAQVLDETLLSSDVERLTRLRDEIVALPASAHTLVISAEMLGQHLHRPKEVRALKAIFDEFCDRYTIIGYLRRQDELSVSRYSTALRRGEKNARPLSRAIDYEAMLSAWSEVFGRDAVVARIFDRGSLVGGDVVRDFADAASLPFEPSPGDTPNQNPSLRAEAQQFLLDLAQRTRAAGADGPLADLGRFEEVNKLLDRHFIGKGMRPPREDALAFYETVRASNEQVRKDWFPERETLFSEDFSAYPEGGATPPAAEAMLDIAMTVLAQMMIARQERPDGVGEFKAKRALAERMRERRREGRGGKGPGQRGKRNETAG